MIAEVLLLLRYLARSSERLVTATLLYSPACYVPPSVDEGPIVKSEPVVPEFAGWSATASERAGSRAAPGSIARHSAFTAPGVVLMPSFVNLGAYVDEGTMVDTWATVGSCAQIGKNCHISGGAGIGGVLEPLQAAPVIIEDDCFIGARSEVAEGVRVGRGSVLSMGVFLGASTRIIDRETGEFLNDPESWLCSAEHGYLWRVGSQLVLSYKHDTGDKRRNRALRSQVGQMPRRPTRRVP